LFVGKSALSHRLFLSVEEPSFQKSSVRKNRAGQVTGIDDGTVPDEFDADDVVGIDV
jgi:hypothetical protein